VKLVIEKTETLMPINGSLARVWKGQTESGVQVVCFISRIAIEKNKDLTEFEKELRPCEPPKEWQQIEKLML
jgi:hypothetical protein